MTPMTAPLLLPRDLEDSASGRDLPRDDRAALIAVSDWIRDFIAQPHKDLGRTGTVCPFVPGALERSTLWYAPERVADRDTASVTELMEGYKRRLLAAPGADGDDAIYQTIIVVFADLVPQRAAGLFAEVLGALAGPSYEEDGLLFGPFYDGKGTAIYNGDFRPFQSPVPFLFVRHTVLSDWKFFLGDETFLDRWARRFGPAATAALAKELRRLPWNARRDTGPDR